MTGDTAVGTTALDAHETSGVLNEADRSFGGDGSSSILFSVRLFCHRFAIHYPRLVFPYHSVYPRRMQLEEENPSDYFSLTSTFSYPNYPFFSFFHLSI